MWKELRCGDFAWNNWSLYSRLVFYNRKYWLLRKFSMTKVYCHYLKHLLLSLVTWPPGPQGPCRPTLWPLSMSMHQGHLPPGLWGSLGNVHQWVFASPTPEGSRIQVYKRGDVWDCGEHLRQLCRMLPTHWCSGQVAPQGKASWARETSFLSLTWILNWSNLHFFLKQLPLYCTIF